MSPFDAPSPQGSQVPVGSVTGADGLLDGVGRRVAYLRVSVTDRCDLRCVYCMPKSMRFAPRPELLTLKEIDRLCEVFIGLGVRKLRLTGGEPLVRKGVLDLVDALGRHLRSGRLDELTLTTNATRLAGAADALFRAGVRRVNVSLDTLDPGTYARITRGGRLADVHEGLAAAKAVGLKVKINVVALADDNRDELPALLAFAHRSGFDIAFIETMPLGEVEAERSDQYMSLSEVKDTLSAVWTLKPAAAAPLSGPARVFEVSETGGRVGFITPLSDNFCATCNRVRVTSTGVLHTCLGHDEGSDLRAPLRADPADAPLVAAILAALARKPVRHEFAIARGTAPTVRRHMSMTGG